MNDLKTLEIDESNGDLSSINPKNSILDATKCKNYKGILYAILSAFTLSCAGIFYKKAQTMSGSDNSLFRYVFQFVIMLGILFYKREPLLGPKDQRKLLLLRSFFGIFAVVSTNFALNFIHPSDNVALTHTNIIIIALMAKLLLKDQLNVSHFIALIFTLTGILLISKPSFIFTIKSTNTTLTNSCQMPFNVHTNDTRGIYKFIGVTLGLVGALGSAAIHICIKKLALNKVYFAVTTFYGTFLGLPTSFFISLALILTHESHANFTCEIQHHPYDIFYGCIGGLFAVGAHILLNLSLEYEEATKVGILRTADLLFSIILQYLVLNIKVDFIELLGGLFIILGTLIVSFYRIFMSTFFNNYNRLP